MKEVAKKNAVKSLNRKINRHKIFTKSKQFLAIGSILHFAKGGAVIWGSGVNGKYLKYSVRVNELDVRMVRGPLTRDILIRHNIKCPEIYGDPALLLSDFYNIKVSSKKYDYIIIPNLDEVEYYENMDNVVSPFEDWQTIVKKILQSKLVISSSLHGIIVAESYGIPARHLLSFCEPVFKYIDYYRGTGRMDYQFARSLKEAIKLGGESMPDTSKLKEAMYQAFPKDIWK